MTTCFNEYEKWQTLGPSDALINMFRAKSPDPTEGLQSKLNHLLNTFMEAYRSTTADEKRLERCCYESKVWYYKILESLLQKEQRHGHNNISRFLEDVPFQCGLVLCCLEITPSTNKLGDHFTPPLLQIFNLAPYNLWKAVSLVLHTQVDLTCDVTAHLLKDVEMIVESLAWTRDSPLWEEIRANGGQLPTCQQVMSPKELEDPRRMEPVDQDPNVSTDPSNDQQNSTLNRTQRSSFLYMFARSVYKLVHKRLRTLCSVLNLQEELCRKTWTCLEYSLVHHFDMLRDMHLDWLLLSAICAMTKNTKDELPLKQVINCYKSKLHKNKQVSKTLMLRGQPELSQDDGKRGRFPTPKTPSVDQEDECIAHFYSQVYTPAMGHFVRKFTPTPGVETPPLSPYLTPPSAPTRKHRVCSGYNIFVSQINKQTASPQPAGMLYNFQSSPSQCLRDINAMVKLRGPPVKRGRALQLDEDDREGASGPSAKIRPLGSLQRRIQDVERDRMHTKHDQVEPSSDH